MSNTTKSFSPNKEEEGPNPLNRQHNPLTDAVPHKYEWVIFIVHCLLALGIAWATTWYFACAFVVLYVKGKRLMFKKVYGWDELTCIDYFFLYDDYKNRANIMAVSIFKRFEAEKVKK